MEQAFQNVAITYEKNVNHIISKYELSVSQSQYDALFVMAYNRPSLLSEGGAVDKMLSTDNCNISDWREAMISEYKQLKGWDKYGKGWTNRIDNQLELYFNEEYARTH